MLFTCYDCYEEKKKVLIIYNPEYLLNSNRRMMSINTLLLYVVAAAVIATQSCCMAFKITQPPSPIKWPFVGTLPDFMIRGGVDNLNGIYEVSVYICMCMY